MNTEYIAFIVICIIFTIKSLVEASIIIFKDIVRDFKYFIIVLRKFHKALNYCKCNAENFN